jgi:hypothetical protein
MAKKEIKSFSFKDIVGMTNGIIKKMPVVHETLKTSKNRSNISTGIYVLNAALSSDIYGGIADNRITVFAAPSGCLHPEEKINIYIMKTLKQHHNIYRIK